MRALLLASALLFSPRPAAASMTARVSVGADSDSVMTAAIMTDLTSAIDEVARRNGYDRSTPLAGWLEIPYLAAASSRPDVADYFTHQSAYATDLGAHMDSIVTAIVDRHLDAAGYAAARKDEMRAAFMRGFSASADKQRQVLDALGRQARMAVALHTFLVKVDAHVAPNAKGDGLVFDRPKDERRYNELAVAIDAANDQVAQAAAPAQPVQPAVNGAQ